MKAATVVIIGLLGGLILAATACGGDEPSPPPRPRATPGPTVVTENGTTPTPEITEWTTPAMDAFDDATGPLVELAIGAAGDSLEFDTSSLTVGTGSRVTLTFDNNSVLNQHNWVLVNDGTKDEVSQRGSSRQGTGYLEPNDPDVIAFTQLLDTGTVVELNFVPSTAGTYQFVCTFPAHNVTMFGSFEVSG